MKRNIYLLFLGALSSALSIESSVACCCSWLTKFKFTETINPNLTEKKEATIITVAAQETLILLNETTTEEEHSKQISDLQQRIGTATHLVFSQKSFLTNEKYGISGIYRGLAPVLQNVISLHFIIKHDSSIDYNELANAIESAPPLEKLENFHIEAPVCLPPEERSAWGKRISTKLPNLKMTQINSVRM